MPMLTQMSSIPWPAQIILLFIFVLLINVVLI
jgi:hypothetical protein